MWVLIKIVMLSQLLLGAVFVEDILCLLVVRV